MVFESLRSHGHLEWTDKTKKRCHIYYKTPEEWGALIYAWARQNGMTGGAVCTFYELTEGEEVQGQPFKDLDRDTLVRALRALQITKKAELFAEDEGVKFF